MWESAFYINELRNYFVLVLNFSVVGLEEVTIIKLTALLLRTICNNTFVLVESLLNTSTARWGDYIGFSKPDVIWSSQHSPLTLGSLVGPVCHRGLVFLNFPENLTNPAILAILWEVKWTISAVKELQHGGWCFREPGPYKLHTIAACIITVITSTSIYILPLKWFKKNFPRIFMKSNWHWIHQSRAPVNQRI